MICRHMPALLRALPDSLQRYILHFEACIEDSARAFAASLPPGSQVLDAGAGESQYEPLFRKHRYTAVDLAIGDPTWSYRKLDALADLSAVPFRSGSFDAVVNIVTLEHVADPAVVISELARVLKPGGRLLLVTPLEWEEHQQPYDYFRYTRYGVESLLRRSGLQIERIEPVGGFFRLLARRLLTMPQFFGPVFGLPVLAFVATPALVLPLLDELDEKRAFTLGHICIARKP